MIISNPGGTIVQPITGYTIYNPKNCGSGKIYNTETGSCISATQWPPHTSVAPPPTGTLVTSSLMQFLSDNWMLVAFGIIAIIVIAFFILRR